MRTSFITAALVILLGCAHVVGQGREPKVPGHYNNESVEKVLLNVVKFTGYGNLIDKALFPRLRTFTLNKDSVTVRELMRELTKQGQLNFDISDAFKVITAEPKTVSGRVIDENGNPVPRASVTIDTVSGMTDENGIYNLRHSIFGSVLVVTAVNGRKLTELVNERAEMPTLVMPTKVSVLDNIEILVNNGYNATPKDRLPGSFSFLTRKQIERTVSSSVLDAMIGKVSGMVFLENRQPGSLQPFALIRGLATIFSNTNPLVVVDNFPFPGNINDININDIENISFLKDAAATSVWGARAANGIIVITTKKAAYKNARQIDVNTSFTFSSRPNVKYLPNLKPDDYVALEQTRYDSGYYTIPLLIDYSIVSPVVDVLDQGANNKISQQEKTDRLKALANYDIRNDIKAGLYRPGFIHRYYVGLRKGGEKWAYYGSLGFDRKNAEKILTSFGRITSQHNFLLRGKSYEVNAMATGIFSNSFNDQPQPEIPFLIGKLRDTDSKALAVPVDVRQSFKDQYKGVLTDWDYRPLEEVEKNKLTQKRNFVGGSILVRDTILKNVTISLMHQQFKITERQENDQSPESYVVRGLRNKTVTFNNGSPTYVLPKGGIYMRREMIHRIQNSRLQVNYNKNDGRYLEIMAQAGIEFSKATADTFSLQVYGHEKDHGFFPQLNYADKYPLFYNPSLTTEIPYQIKKNNAMDFFTSAFANAGCTINGRYSFSISGRIDQTNLVGVKEKQKQIPLASIGGKWDMLKDSLFKIKWLSYLNLKSTYGTSGNVNKAMLAYTTAERAPENRYGAPTVGIINLANDYFRWEKSSMFNLAVEGADSKHHISFTLEYYSRWSIFLIQPASQESTLGSRVLWDNVARMKGKGFDISVTSSHVAGSVKIRNSLFFSQATNKVIGYRQTLIRAQDFTDQQAVTPRTGYQVYSLYAFKWAGLDPLNGDPMGYLNGEKSKNYTAIVNGSPDELVYKGSTLPVFWGGFSSVISYKLLEIAATFTGRFKYYFRRGAISWSDPFDVTLAGQYDYAKRWQKPGHENTTTVPSMKVNPETNRDFFYAHSEANVERADQIRLQEVKISYNFIKLLEKIYRVRSCYLYVYASNVGIIWRANKSRIDPDFLYRPPMSSNFSVGARFEF